MLKLRYFPDWLCKQRSAISSEPGVQDDFAFAGYKEHRVVTKYVDVLDDRELQSLNRLLPWKCFTVDSNGRRFGNRAWAGKREQPQPVPDPRIVALNHRWDLRDKDVLELGCFEGVHTTGLCFFGAKVTAVDARIENVVKTIVRCAMFGYSPKVFLYDLEKGQDYEQLPRVDIVHHVGVLYHLTDPVHHLRMLLPRVKSGLMLDTHYANDSDAKHVYEVDGKEIRYQHYKEAGKSESGKSAVFAGMRDHAKWLRLDDILASLAERGFADVEVAENQKQRNGFRVLLYAQRANE